MHRVELLLRDTRLATAEQRLKSPAARSPGLGFSPPSCAVSPAPLLPSGFYTGLRKELYLSVIKLTSFAGSAQPLVWQTFLYSRSEYPGQTRLRAAGGVVRAGTLQGHGFEAASGSGTVGCRRGQLGEMPASSQSPPAQGNPIPCCEHA